MPTDAPDQTAYGAWAAPKFDEALFIWPDGSGLVDVAQQNAALRSMRPPAPLLDVPADEVRTAARQYLNVDPAKPLIVTGHQSELHHPGVWVKNALIHAVAEACGGTALHLALDTDAPKHLTLKWPGFAKPFTDDPRLHGRAWTGLLHPPSPEHLESLIDAADQANADEVVGDALPAFLRECRAFLVDQRDAIAPLDLPAMLADAMHRADWALGLRYDLTSMSGLVQSPAWLLMVAHLCRDAEAFANFYNAVLNATRHEAGETDPQRPMPNLAVEEDAIELPFWVDDLESGVRHRLQVDREGCLIIAGRKRFAVTGDGWEAATSLQRWLWSHRLRIASRALSLTIFCRLYLGDLFVHGIGGAHYDQVADRIIAAYFRTAAPTFAVATATLLHPGHADRERPCLPCLKREGHRLRHRVLDDKSTWLERIEQQPDFHSRRGVFEAMHAAREAAMERDPALLDWRRRYAEAVEAESSDAVWFDRELFYLVQPEPRLKALIARVLKDVGAVK